MKLKKVLTTVLAGVMAVGMLTACGSKDADSETTTAAKVESKIDISDVKLISDGTLTIGCEAGYPPFEMESEDGSDPIGFDMDIMAEVAERLGLELNIINTGWDGIFAGLDVNYDVVCSGVTITPERQKTMIFTDPYISNYQTVVVKKGSDLKVESFNDLDGKSISVQKETTSDILMSDYKKTGTIDVNIVANEKLTSCFSQLKNGEIDAVVVDSSVAAGYVAKSPEDFEIAFTDDSEPEDFGIALGQKNTALQKAINEALAQMKKDGFIDETANYWFGSSEE